MSNQLWFLPLVAFCVMFASYFLFVKLEGQVQLRERLKFTPKKSRRVFSETLSTKQTEKTWFETNILDALKNKNKKAVGNFRLRFERCGWDPASAPILVPICMVSFIALSMFSYYFLYQFTTLLENFNTISFVGVGLIFFFLGYRGFDYLTDYKMAQRREQIIKDIPMCIDLLVICVRGGLSFDTALDRVAQEVVHLNPELSRELALTSAELGILPDRKVAYSNLARRVDGDLIRTLTMSLTQAEEQGVAIGKTLVTLSQEASKMKLLMVETKAAKLPSKLTVPVVLLSLPAILIIILGPTIAAIKDSDLFK